MGLKTKMNNNLYYLRIINRKFLSIQKGAQYIDYKFFGKLGIKLNNPYSKEHIFTGDIRLNGVTYKKRIGDAYFKGDTFGYDAAAEVIASEILKNSNINEFAKYKIYTYINPITGHIHKGCKSDNFEKDGYKFISIYDLFVKELGGNKEARRYFNSLHCKFPIKAIKPLYPMQKELPALKIMVKN